jgi:aldehyde:ferredoxin oxidoreductase
MSMKYKGFAGKILRINLTTSKISTEDVTDELVERYLGGAGFVSYYLYNELKPDTDPLGPDNKLFFCIGPFTGTLWPQGSRYVVAAMSPLGAGWGEAHSAGHWGPELKLAGYDGIIVEGKATKPVYIKIINDTVSIEDASHLWGKNVKECEDILKKDIEENVRVASIGQAGENLVRVAAIMNDTDRAAARSGLGAVMGSKNLKAIAVRGTGGVEVADEEGYLDVMYELREKMLADPLTPGRVKYGTTSLVELMNEIGRFPTRNLQMGQFDEADKINGEACLNYLIKPRADFACTQRCARYSQVKCGRYAFIGGGPEYETQSALGSRCGNSNLLSILFGHYLCNMYGMDTIGVGGTISWAMECYEKGLITKADTSGLDLKWGDHELITKLIHMIANREGFGNVLAEGSYRAAEKIGNGTEKYVMAVKKHEIAGQDGRAQKSMGLAMAVAPRGADHLYAFPVLDEVGFTDMIGKVYGDEYLPEIGERLDCKHKGYMIRTNENFSVVVESLGACKYGTMVPPALFYDEVRAGLKATTGLDLTKEQLEQLGERIVNLNRMFNVRMGMDRKDDMLPDRCTKEPLPTGPPKGHVCEIDILLDDYYSQRRWTKNGIPKEETLRELGLEHTIKDLPDGSRGGDANA